MGSPLGAANYVSLLQCAASLERMGNTELAPPPVLARDVDNVFACRLLLPRVLGPLPRNEPVSRKSSGVTRSLSQVGKTKLKGVHWPP